ncbi:MAG: AI-2E family transporter [Gammaproteobacteria bacterium]|nr:AI-2E family transporter [Gammaproteobacteria bacterium]
MLERQEDKRGARVLGVLASVVVVVAGLKLAGSILSLFFLALVLAILTLPVMMWLRRYGVPSPLAILISVLLVAAVVGGLLLLASQAFAEFQARYPAYEIRLLLLWEVWEARLAEVELPLVGNVFAALTDLFSFEAALDFATGTIQRVLALVTDTFLVLLIMVFILAEAAVFPRKLRMALGDVGSDSIRLTNIVREVQTYLTIKTLVSLATGITIGLFAAAIGLDFPVLLGLIGFVLNYIPTIGSVIASVPAVLLALIQFGLGSALGVGVVYLGINTVFGNIIEPNLMGRRLGLSTLVVVLSLIFWGWVWGPLGMFLSIPLTMILKILLENTPDLRWMAVLLGKGLGDSLAREE